MFDFQRLQNDGVQGFVVRPIVRHFQDPAEGALADALAKARAELGDVPSDLAHFASVATALVVPINAFFDAVLVMAEDPAVRANRLGLLAGIRDLSEGLVGWEALG